MGEVGDGLLTLSIIKVHLDPLEAISHQTNESHVARCSYHRSNQCIKVKSIENVFGVQFLLIDVFQCFLEDLA